MEKSDSLLSKLDYTLLFIVFLLFCYSLVAIYKAPIPSNLGGNHYFVIHQLMWYVVGGLFSALFFFIDYERLKPLTWILYGVLMLPLIGLIAKAHGVPVPLARASHGAVSWYHLPGLGDIQPAEFMKIVLILLVGRMIIDHNELYPTRHVVDDLKLLGKISGVSLPPIFLILIQPDLGTVMLLFATIVSMVLVSGIRWRLIGGLFLIAVCGIGGLVLAFFKAPFLVHFLLKSHQLDRFYGWLAPYKYSNSEGYQLINSISAIGSGELYGKGLSHTMNYLPEGYNDFIFSVIGSEFGFIGSSLLISIYFMLIYRVIYTALKTHDPFGSYVCTGIIGMITFTIFENIGMTIQVMPITGVPLPFISYGGSSLLTNMMAIGIVLSIRARARKYMFD
jgi:rod shape determining protein RodA